MGVTEGFSLPATGPANFTASNSRLEKSNIEHTSNRIPNLRFLARPFHPTLFLLGLSRITKLRRFRR